MQNARVFQIHYDDASRGMISPAAIPLDNSRGPADWFEFSPILNYLTTHELEDDVFYGFLSPKFETKSGVRVSDLIDCAARNPDVEVILAPMPIQALFRNLWIQGDAAHAGLIARAEAFFRHAGEDADLRAVDDLTSSVFSNSLLAKKSFWSEWVRLAVKYKAFVETTAEGVTHRDIASYVYPVEYKVFIQERFPTHLLAKGRYKVATVDLPFRRIHGKSLAGEKAARLHRLLLRMDGCKSRYRKTGNSLFLSLHRLWRIEFYRVFEGKSRLGSAFRFARRRMTTGANSGYSQIGSGNERE